MTTLRFEIPGRPVGKPRMTKADRWKKRPCVLKYWKWADGARESFQGACEASGLDLAFAQDSRNVTRLDWVARFCPAKSWSKKKKAEHLGKTHRHKPDRDNIDKALLDALFKESQGGDSGIGPGFIDKVWSDRDCLEVVIEYELGEV